MADLPPLLPSREIKKGIAAVIALQHDLIRDIQEIDAAIGRLPRGREKQQLRLVQNELKQQLGLVPEPRSAPRDGWSSEQWAAKAVELKDAARRWTAAGRLERAKRCLSEAGVAEREAAERRSAEQRQRYAAK